MSNNLSILSKYFNQISILKSLKYCLKQKFLLLVNKWRLLRYSEKFIHNYTVINYWTDFYLCTNLVKIRKIHQLKILVCTVMMCYKMIVYDDHTVTFRTWDRRAVTDCPYLGWWSNLFRDFHNSLCWSRYEVYYSIHYVDRGMTFTTGTQFIMLIEVWSLLPVLNLLCWSRYEVYYRYSIHYVDQGMKFTTGTQFIMLIEVWHLLLNLLLGRKWGYMYTKN